MAKSIKVGDVFEVNYKSHKSTFVRGENDHNGAFECEYIKVTVLSNTWHPKSFKPYTFYTDQEWFKQRGLEVE
jgi:hypothetical protein